jgi:hypothetical protein
VSVKEAICSELLHETFGVFPVSLEDLGNHSFKGFAAGWCGCCLSGCWLASSAATSAAASTASTASSSTGLSSGGWLSSGWWLLGLSSPCWLSSSRELWSLCWSGYLCRLYVCHCNCCHCLHELFNYWCIGLVCSGDVWI